MPPDRVGKHAVYRFRNMNEWLTRLETALRQQL